MITDVVFIEGDYGCSFHSGIVTDVVSILLPVEKTRGLLDLDVATDHRQSLSGFYVFFKSHPPLWKNTQTLLLRPKCQVADSVVFNFER